VWVNYNLTVDSLHMKPFYGDKDITRNSYKNHIDYFMSPDDLFLTTTKRVVSWLRFLKLNIRVGDKQLDGVRVVSRKK